MTDYAKEHELMRRKVWSAAWCATTSADNCLNGKTATEFADAALAAFDARFEPLQDAGNGASPRLARQ